VVQHGQVSPEAPEGARKYTAGAVYCPDGAEIRVSEIKGFFFWVLKGKVRTGSSGQGRTLPSNTKTRIGQTLGIVLGTLDTLQARRLAESLQVAGR
jgi:hypothetical protein